MAKRKAKSPRRKALSDRRTRKRTLSVANDHALKRSAQAVELALAAFAHDIRTPLTGILAIGELLATSELSDRERRWVATLRTTAEHLASLTTLVVDAARAEAKGLVLRQDMFEPKRLAESAAALFTVRATAKGLQSSVNIASDLPAWSRGDSLRLRAVLENLLDNAIKFTERGAVALTVDAQPLSRQRTRLIFSVSDSGIGISAAEVKRLFRPFAQASDSVAHRFGGAGIGLSFVRRLARAMGGNLTVMSKAGSGSTFRLSVVVANVTNGSDNRGESRRLENMALAGPPLRILCLEDNPYGRVVMNTILTQLGYEADYVGTSDAAVDAVARGVYGLVLMDVKHGGIDGIEATRRIRALSGVAGRTPIIGISGHVELIDEAVARAAGMDAFLAKPVSPNGLASAIRAATGTS
ncbi:MAG: response regulator [Bradyrhizobiaceae bacterium]|nr:response regulator [Bradyrhizobiaceae bacterium]